MKKERFMRRWRYQGRESNDVTFVHFFVVELESIADFTTLTFGLTVSTSI